MSEKRIIRRSPTSTVPSRTDWKRVDALTDEDIKRAVDDDPDAAPLLDEEWFARARITMPSAKALISIRVDKAVLDFFRATGPGYQTRMNAVLRAFVGHEAARRMTDRIKGRHLSTKPAPSGKKAMRKSERVGATKSASRKASR